MKICRIASVIAHVAYQANFGCGQDLATQLEGIREHWDELKEVTRTIESTNNVSGFRGGDEGESDKFAAVTASYVDLDVVTIYTLDVEGTTAPTLCLYHYKNSDVVDDTGYNAEVKMCMALWSMGDQMLYDLEWEPITFDTHIRGQDHFQIVSTEGVSGDVSMKMELLFPTENSSDIRNATDADLADLTVTAVEYHLEWYTTTEDQLEQLLFSPHRLSGDTVTTTQFGADSGGSWFVRVNEYPTTLDKSPGEAPDGVEDHIPESYREGGLKAVRMSTFREDDAGGAEFASRLRIEPAALNLELDESDEGSDDRTQLLNSSSQVHLPLGNIIFVCVILAVL